MCTSFMDLLEEHEVGDPFLVVGNDVLVFDTREGVAILEVVVGVLSESFIASHSHSGEVVSVARAIIGRLVSGREEARQCCLVGDALCWGWCLSHHKREVSLHVVFVTFGATIVLLNGWLEVFGVCDRLETS
jgi:hypothetical protein